MAALEAEVPFSHFDSKYLNVHNPWPPSEVAIFFPENICFECKENEHASIGFQARSGVFIPILQMPPIPSSQVWRTDRHSAAHEVNLVTKSTETRSFIAE